MAVSDKIREYVPFYARNLKIAVPVMLSQVGQGVVIFVDTYMVGRLGTAELAAVSFSGAVLLPFMLFVMGVSMGQTPLVGQASAVKDRTRVMAYFQGSFVVNVLLMSAMCVLLWLFSLFFDRMGQDATVVELARPYYMWVVLSLLPLPFFYSLKQLLEGLGNTKYSMYITLISNLLNIVFNYLLIFGKFGFPELGVIGAGVSTFISRLFMPLMLALLLCRDARYKCYLHSLAERLVERSHIRTLLSVGLPIGGQMFAEMLLFAGAGVMVGWFGATQLAAHQVVLNFSSMTFMFQCGISAATTIRVSHQLGARDYLSMRMAGIASLHLSFVLNFVFSVVMLIFSRELVAFFSADEAVVEVGVRIVFFCALYQIADGFQVVSLGSLRGMTDVRWPMRMAAISYVLISLPVGYICSVWLGWEVYGVWVGFIVGLNIAAACFIVRFLRRSAALVKCNVNL